MALTAEEQEFLDFALAALPTWFHDDARQLEDLGMLAKMIGAARAQLEDWFTHTLIGDATGPVGSDPDWLDQHARDRGTSRVSGESDAALRARLQSYEDAVTRDELIAVAQATVDAEGILGGVAMVELKRDRGFLGTFTSMSGTGGVFTKSGAHAMTFLPDTLPWDRPPFEIDFPGYGWQLVFSGASNPANDGTFEVKGIEGNAAAYVNTPGASSTDPGVSWTAQKLDQDLNLADGYARAFYGRGYRMGTQYPTIVVIIPYGTGAIHPTAATAAAVTEALRQKKGAGIRVLVEYRQSP